MAELTDDHIKTIYDTQQLTREMHGALIGNEALGHKGLVMQQKENTDNIEKNTKGIRKINSDKKKAKWVILGLGFGAGLGGSKIAVAIAKLIQILGF